MEGDVEFGGSMRDTVSWGSSITLPKPAAVHLVVARYYSFGGREHSAGKT